MSIITLSLSPFMYRDAIYRVMYRDAIYRVRAVFPVQSRIRFDNLQNIDRIISELGRDALKDEFVCGYPLLFVVHYLVEIASLFLQIQYNSHFGVEACERHSRGLNRIFFLQHIHRDVFIVLVLDRSQSL